MAVHPLINFVIQLAVVVLVYATGIFWTVLAVIKRAIEWYKGKLPNIPNKTRTSPPAILNDPDLGEHGFLHLKNGIRLHYVAAGDADKALMLCVHGFPDFWFAWRHQLRHFKDRYRVVAIDCRGYGDSDKPAGVSSYTMARLVSDIQLTIQALDYKSCVLVAHDWGALISWTFASAHPEMVDKLIILNCPHPDAFIKFAKTSFKQFLKSWYQFMFQLPWFPEFLWSSNDMFILEAAYTKPPHGVKAGAITSAEMEAYKYTFGKPGAFTGPINYYRANLISRLLEEKNNGHGLPFPVLLIFGTADHALSVEAAVMSGDYVDGYFEIKLLEGVSHWVQHEASDRVNEIMEQFLSSNHARKGHIVAN